MYLSMHVKTHPEMASLRITNKAIFIQTCAPGRGLNRTAAQTQVQAGVTPELG
jgi:hypothetical protein